MSGLDVLRIPAFRHLWLGQAISQLGDAFYYLVFFFMVDKLTGSPALVAAFGAVEALPYLLFSLYAGVVADRLDRRGIMLWSDVGSAFLLVGFSVLLVLAPSPSVAAIFVVGFLLSLVKTFFLPAKSAAIPALVPSAKLLEANSLSAATQNMMPLVGVALSGGILGALYLLYPNGFFVTAVLVNAASFLLSAVYIYKLPRVLPERDRGRQSHAWADFKSGITFIWRSHILKVLVLVGLFISLFISPFLVVHVTVNREWFGQTPTPEILSLMGSLSVVAPMFGAAGPAQQWIKSDFLDGTFLGLATLEFAFFAGMVVSSLLVGRFNVRRPGLSLGYGLAVVGLGVVLMAFSRSFWLYAVWNVVCGLALPFAQVPMNTYVQIIVPDAYRGRVNSAMTLASIGVVPLGMSLAAPLIAVVGLVGMFLLMGGGMMAVALVGLLDRQFRTSTMDDRPEMPPEPVASDAGCERAEVASTSGRAAV
ncbi:MAG TPA: MFS transporter [Fimbriimonadaceae bacterium]|nr:MFS transporter [Fimbriimonadaceae bacterium]